MPKGAEVIPRVQLRNNILPLAAFVKESVVARNKAASGPRWMGLRGAQESMLALRKRERSCEQWVMMMRVVVVVVVAVAIDESKLAFMGCMRRERTDNNTVKNVWRLQARILKKKGKEKGRVAKEKEERERSLVEN